MAEKGKESGGLMDMMRQAETGMEDYLEESTRKEKDSWVASCCPCLKKKKEPTPLSPLMKAINDLIQELEQKGKMPKGAQVQAVVRRMKKGGRLTG